MLKIFEIFYNRYHPSDVTVVLLGHGSFWVDLTSAKITSKLCGCPSVPDAVTKSHALGGLKN